MRSILSVEKSQAKRRLGGLPVDWKFGGKSLESTACDAI